MPLRFGPGSGKDRSATPLAVVYTLRHEDPVILKTYSSNRNERAPGRGRRTPRSTYIFLPSATETTQGTKEEEEEDEQQQQQHSSSSRRRRRIISSSGSKIAPLKQKDFFYGGRGEGSSYTIPPLVEIEPIDFPVMSVPLRRPLPLSQQLLPLLHHNDVPLPLALAVDRTLPQRRIQSQARRANWVGEVLVNSRVSVTWEEILEVSRVAWDSALKIPAAIALPLPNPPVFLPHMLLPAQMLERYDASSHSGSRNNNFKTNDNVICYIVDSTVVPIWRPDGPPKKRGMLRWCPIVPDLNALIVWNLTWQALPNQETVLQCHFHETTTPPPEATRPTFPAATVVLVPSPLINEGADVHDTFEQIHTVVPYISPMRMRKTTRRQQCYASIQSTLMQNLSSSAIPKRMERAKELRFPEDKYVRQTLTLRNVAAERLQHDVTALEICHRRRRLRKGVVEWLRGGSTPVFQRRDLWTVVLLSSRALSDTHQFGLPKYSEVRNKDENECQLQPPLLILSPSILDGAALVVSYFSSSWMPLAVEEVDDGSCCRRKDPVLCPQRVFSREEELQSFRTLRERGMQWGEKEEIDISNVESIGEGKGEGWYHAAFLHDIHTMALPYRDSIAIIEDAKLHYYCQLALHREKQRLGLHEAR